MGKSSSPRRSAMENIDMKKSTLFTAAFSILALAVSSNAIAQNENGPDETSCSIETLKGSYAYSIQGYRDGKPYASAGLMSFNGAGRAALIWTSSVERKQLFTTGTYTVESNCSGQMTLDITTINNFYLSPSGDSFTFVRISGDGVIGTEARRVTEGLIIKQP